MTNSSALLVEDVTLDPAPFLLRFCRHLKQCLFEPRDHLACWGRPGKNEALVIRPRDAAISRLIFERANLRARQPYPLHRRNIPISWLGLIS